MVFVETAAFSRRVVALLSDDEYSRLQIALLDKPDAGAVIKGGGGIRKLKAAEGFASCGGGRRAAGRAAAHELFTTGK